MKIQRWIAATLVAGGLMAAMPAIAHHSNAVFYDSTKKVEIQGAVTKFVFRNPHAFLYLDAEDAGQKTEWQIELGAPVGLTRTGWTPDTLKPGTVIKAAGQPAKEPGARGMCCARITRPDGSPIVAGGRVTEEPAAGQPTPR